MLTVLTLVFFGSAVLFLSYTKSLENVPVRMQTGVRASKYVIAVFVSIYGSAAIALLVSSPLSIAGRLTHSEASSNLWSALLDRPYFPLQIFVACALGVITFHWLRDGWPKLVWILQLVWILPLVQTVVAIAVFRHRFGPFHADWAGIRETFFNWDCGCSASLPQWAVMFPLYTSIAFALGAAVRSRMARELSSREFQRTKVH